MTGQGAGSAGTLMHVPVLLAEVIDALRPAADQTYIDATFGAGGYTTAILEAATCRVLAIDRDPTAIAFGSDLVARYGGRLRLCEGRFGDLAGIARAQLASASENAPLVDGIVLDIGVSSMQVDDPTRGFSFMADGPLDMRMGSHGRSAADIVAEAGEAELADIVFEFGEERHARRIARAIVRAREVGRITRTLQLAEIVGRAIGRAKPGEIHPATRTFQALRILVNDELAELTAALHAAEGLLRPGGRLVVVTFHSLEDRIVKQFLSARARPPRHGSRHAPPTGNVIPAPSFRLEHQRPIVASEVEISINPRARSAKLRAAVRTEAPSWPIEQATTAIRR